jgi:hypothetical protein
MKAVFATLSAILLVPNMFIPLFILFYALTHQIANLIITCIIFIITIISFVMVSSLFLFFHALEFPVVSAKRGYYE